MDKNLINKRELQDALCDVRKAHRLLYEYQDRIVKLMSYIKDKYAMTEMCGNKFFSSPISVKRRGYAPLDVFSHMWAWDFLYSYMFEFYMGRPKRDGKYFCFSVIQVSDSGFFDSREDVKIKEDTNTFKSAEESSSYLIFVFESIMDENSKFSWDGFDFLNRKVVNFLESGKSDYLQQTNENNYFVLQKYKIEDFIDNASTDMILSQFDKKIKELTNINLLKKEIDT